MAERKRPVGIGIDEFKEMFRQVSNWGRFGEAAERGTLNYITPRTIRAAAALVHTGRTVSLAVPISTTAGPDNPRPARHLMVQGYDTHPVPGGPDFVTDYLASEFHGDCFTHIDALCHVAWQGKLFDGIPTDAVTTHGADRMDITVLAHGIVGRGVLLDIPRLRGVRWLEPGEAVGQEELEAAEKAEGVRVGPGDVLVFRTGQHARRLAWGPWDNGYDGEGRAGLHVDTIPWLHERQVAVFFPDGDGETVPATVKGVSYPIHALQIASMGMICADSLNLEDCAAVCEEEKRWEFMVTAAPLRLPRATGSLFNPTAIF
jgi:kynurenine formamidase